MSSSRAMPISRRPLALGARFAVAIAIATACSPTKHVTNESQQAVETPVATSAVGTLPGEMDVDASGRFRYRIPIEVPPGRAGVQPNLTISYSSTQTETSLGVGFEVAGFSSITRCPRTFAQDDVHRPVQLDNGDAYCLDGQRLIADPDSPPDGDGTRYRTKLDRLSRITSYTNAPSRISHWVVEGPDGSLRRYGENRNARQEVSRDGRSVVVTWFLEEVRDAHGNNITYDYDHVIPTPPAGVGQREPLELVQPGRITYTGFYDGATQLVGTRTVDFIYIDPIRPGTHEIVPNPEAKRGWFLGHFFYDPSARRLLKIRTAVEGTIVREYRFHGSHDPNSRRWRIDRIQGCANAPAASPNSVEDGMVCLTQVFEWKDPPNTAASRDPVFAGETFLTHRFKWPDRKKTWMGTCSDGISPCIELNPVLVLDVNGDGADDLLYVTANQTSRWGITLRLGRHSARSSEGWLLSPLYDDPKPTSGAPGIPLATTSYSTLDYDFDGRDDLIYVDLEGQVVVLRSLGEDFVPITAGLPRFDLVGGPVSGRWLYAAHVTLDLDGDARSDLLVCQTEREVTPPRSTWHYALRIDAGFAPLVDTGIETNCALENIDDPTNPYDVAAVSPGKVVGDFDGDGLAEMLITGPNGFRLLRWDHALGGVTAIETNLSADHVRRPRTVDLNGDGAHDLVGLNQRTSEWDPDRWHHRAMSLGEPGKFIDHSPDEDSPDSRPFGPRSFGLGPYRIVRQIGSDSGGRAVHSKLLSPAIDLDGDGRGDVLVQTLPDDETLPVAIGGDQYEWAASELHALFTVDGFATRDYQTAASIRGPQMNGGEAANLYFWPSTLIADADGDGAADLLEYIDVRHDFLSVNPEVRVHLNLRGGPMLVAGVRDGLSAYHKVEYAPLADPDVYTRGTDCRYPVRCVSDSRHVVSVLHVEDGKGGHRRLQYRYKDGRADVRGLGWLGFAERRVLDTATNTTTVTTYVNRGYDPTLRAYPRAGTVAAQYTRSVAEPVAGAGVSLRTLSSVVAPSYDVVAGTIPGTYRLEERRVVTKEYRSMGAPTSDDDLLPGTRVGLKEAIRTFDEYGNVTEERVTFDGTSIVTKATATYHNDPARWWLGLQTSYSTTTTEGDCTFGSATVTEYRPDSRQVFRTTEQPDRPEDRVVTTYGFDRFGNLTDILAEAADVPDRRDHIFYDPDGYFPVEQRNALGHAVTIKTSRRTGLPLSQTDANGVEARWDYDGFGRIRRSSGDGVETWETTYVHGGAQPLQVSTTNSTGALRGVKLDRLGRTVNQFWNNPSGTFIRELSYDARGVLTAISTPSQTQPVAVPPAGWARQTVDNLGLVRRAETADGVIVHASYDLSSSSVRDAIGAVARREFDEVGRLVKVHEPAPGGTTSYRYCGATALHRVIDPDGNTTKLGYDELGRRTSIDDPDRGTTSYTYTAHDELSTLRDNGGRTTRYKYDSLGRVVTREDLDDGLETTFEYDTARMPSGAPVLGALHRTAGSSGEVVDELQYDELARATTHWRHVDGQTLTTSMSYDAAGRVEGITYPTTFAAPPLKVRYHYAATGEVTSIDADDRTVWRMLEPSAHGIPRRVRYGHGIELTRTFTNAGRIAKLVAYGTVAGGIRKPLDLAYTFDTRGLIRTRDDQIQGRLETYHYDELSRLTRVTSTDPAYAQQYGYDRLGNLTSAHDVAGGLVYAGGGAGELPLPHAVTSVGGVSYRYDDAGRLVRRGALELTYNQLDLPKLVESPTTGASELVYAADGTRAIRRGATRKTLYLPGFYQRETDASGIRETFFVAGPQEVFLQIDRTVGKVPTDHYRYLHRDVLGSVVAITDPAGSVKQAGYDAFGKVVSSTLPDAIERGFTGHEHDTDELINMGGRMYDARARRFLTPDPFVASPSLQQLNRYSYVYNNPVNLVDPTGFQPRAHRFSSGGRASVPRGAVVVDDVIVFPQSPEFTFGTDTSAAERAGAGAGGQASNLGSSLGNPATGPSTLAEAIWGDFQEFRTETPLAEGRMTPEQWTDMYIQARSTLELTADVSTYSAYLGGAAALAALIAPATLVGVAAEIGGGVAAISGAVFEVGVQVGGLMARHQIVNVAVSGGMSLVYSLNDAHVPTPVGAGRQVIRASQNATAIRVLDGDLVDAIIDARAAAYEVSRNRTIQTNGAIVEYFDPITRTLQTVTRFSSGDHAEIKCLAEIQRRLGDSYVPSLIRRVYTERRPCPGCSPVLGELPLARIFYTFETDREARSFLWTLYESLEFPFAQGP